MITHDIRSDLNLVISTWRGDVDDDLMVEAYRRLYSSSEWKAGFDELVDLRLSGLAAVTAEGLWDVSRLVAERTGELERPFKTAALVSADLTFGMVRMYEMLSDGSPETVRVFREPREALQWLEAPGDLLD
jgi:hypothetical protein